MDTREEIARAYALAKALANQCANQNLLIEWACAAKLAEHLYELVNSEVEP